MKIYRKTRRNFRKIGGGNQIVDADAVAGSLSDALGARAVDLAGSSGLANALNNAGENSKLVEALITAGNDGKFTTAGVNKIAGLVEEGVESGVGHVKAEAEQFTQEQVDLGVGKAEGMIDEKIEAASDIADQKLEAASDIADQKLEAAEEILEPIYTGIIVLIVLGGMIVGGMMIRAFNWVLRRKRGGRRTLRGGVPRMSYMEMAALRSNQINENVIKQIIDKVKPKISKKKREIVPRILRRMINEWVEGDKKKKKKTTFIKFMRSKLFTLRKELKKIKKNKKNRKGITLFEKNIDKMDKESKQKEKEIEKEHLEKKKQTLKIFKALDRDGDGSITAHEFAHPRPPSSKSKKRRKTKGGRRSRRKRISRRRK